MPTPCCLLPGTLGGPQSLASWRRGGSEKQQGASQQCPHPPEINAGLRDKAQHSPWLGVSWQLGGPGAWVELPRPGTGAAQSWWWPHTAPGPAGAKLTRSWRPGPTLPTPPLRPGMSWVPSRTPSHAGSPCLLPPTRAHPGFGDPLWGRGRVLAGSSQPLNAPHDPDPCREPPSSAARCDSTAQPPLPSVPPAPHQHSSSWLCKARMGWGGLCAAPAPSCPAGRSAEQPQPLGAGLGLGPSAAGQRGGRQRGGAPRLPQTPALAVRAAAGRPVQKHTPLAFAESFFFFLL